MGITTFNELKIKQELLDALVDMGFSEPTAVQSEAIPYILEGKDCLAQAPTGTGKTCAFGIPALNLIDLNSSEIEVLIMCPTRELVMQTEKEIKKLAKHLPKARVLAIYGGQNISRQLAGLRKKPQIIVGTPGRVMDHMRRKTLKLTDLKLLVLDEADEMLNMGFKEDMDWILESAPNERQTIMFSATMSKDILEISKNYQTDPVSVKTKIKDNTIPQIAQYYVRLKENKKFATLAKIMEVNNYKLVLIFCNTKRRVDELNSLLNDNGYISEALHGDLRQRSRDEVMRKYRTASINILVATDVAARGIDVDNIEAIFNYDVPNDDEYYVHRIGRTARANRSGAAYSFVTDKTVNRIRDFERYTKSVIKELGGFNDMELKRDFDKVLKSALSNIGSNIETEKGLIKDELDKFNQSMVTNYTFLDIAAILLKTANVVPTLSETSSSAEKKSRVSAPSRSSRSNQDTTRYFMNIGLKDKVDEEAVIKLLTTNSTIQEKDITEVKLLDIFSFVEVSNGFEEDMMSLNNIKFGRRSLSVEKAGAKTESRGERKPYAPSGERKPYSSSSGERKPYERSEKPYGDRAERKPYAPSGERKPYDGERKPYERSEKPYGDRAERKPYSSSSGERKPYGSSTSERKPYDGERKPYAPSGERKPYDGERKPYAPSGERKPYGSSTSERKPRAPRAEDGIPSYEGFNNEERPFVKKESSSSFADKKPTRTYGDKPARKPRTTK